MELCIVKDERKEKTNDKSTSEDDGSNPVIQVSQERENVLNLLSVVSLKRFKKKIANTSRDA